MVRGNLSFRNKVGVHLIVYQDPEKQTNSFTDLKKRPSKDQSGFCRFWERFLLLVPNLTLDKLQRVSWMNECMYRVCSEVLGLYIQSSVLRFSLRWNNLFLTQAIRTGIKEQTSFKNQNMCWNIYSSTALQLRNWCMINNKNWRKLVREPCTGTNMFTRLGSTLKGHEVKMHGGSLPSALLDR